MTQSSAAATLGFTPPSVKDIIEGPKNENIGLIEKKRAILTELAAIETGFDIFDFINPARDSLLSSATQTPCGVEVMLSQKNLFSKLDVANASQDLANLITEIGENPSKSSYQIKRKEPHSQAIVKHAKTFFAQEKLIEDTQAGFKTAFTIMPVKSNTKPMPSSPAESEIRSNPSNNAYPFFPDIIGLNSRSPLLGLMKESLGELPSFIKNPPDNDELEELRLQATPDLLKNHLLDICGNSSDDDFDGDYGLLDSKL